MSNKLGSIKRFLLAAGISFCAFGQLVNAAPAGVVKHYRTQGLDNVIRYEIELTETTAGGADQYELSAITYSDDSAVTITAGSVHGEVLNSSGGGKIETANVVVEVPVATEELKVKSSRTGETDQVATITLSHDDDSKLDNTGPVLKWAYKNVEGNYIQFEAEDAKVIIDRILDQNDKDRVIIQEKDKAQKVTAKYKLRDGDISFKVLDRLGNTLVVNIENDVEVEYTLAAKNIEGTTVVLNMKLPQGATLDSIKTVDDEAVPAGSGQVTYYGKKANNDDDELVAIYTSVPKGTTFVYVTYTDAQSQEKTIQVDLDLDLSSPELVMRNVEGDGSIVESGGQVRVYKNYDSTMAIVEVKDMVSGITRIASATEDTTVSEFPATETTGEEPNQVPTPTNQSFDIKDLPTSVVQLIKLPSTARYIRIHDGIDNVTTIDLADVPVVYGNTAEAGDAGMELELKAEGNDVHATYRSRKAGLKKFVKVTPEGVRDARAVAEVLTAGETSALTTAANNTLAVWSGVIATAKSAADTAQATAEADSKSTLHSLNNGTNEYETERRKVRSNAIHNYIINAQKDEAAKTAAKNAIKTALKAAAEKESEQSYEEEIIEAIVGEGNENHTEGRIAAIEEALAKLMTYRAEQVLIEEIAKLNKNDNSYAAVSEAGKTKVSLGYETTKITVQEVDAVLKLVTNTEGTGTCATDGDREYMIDKITDGTDNIYLPIQTTEDIKTWYPVTEQTKDIDSESLITISGAQLQKVPEYVAVDVFGNTKLFNLNDILFKAGVEDNPNDDTNHYIYVNNDSNNKTQLISLKVQDIRRVKKITATINDGSEVKEKTLETFEIDSAPSASSDLSTQDVDRVYQIKKGEVTAVTVYHWNDQNDHNEHYNGITQNVVTMQAGNRVAETVGVNATADRTSLVKITKTNNQDYTYNVEVKYGIKRIDYYDGPNGAMGTVLEFYDEIPKKADVFSKVNNGASDVLVKVVVTDALGYTYELGEGHDTAALEAYGTGTEVQSGS